MMNMLTTVIRCLWLYTWYMAMSVIMNCGSLITQNYDKMVVRTGHYTPLLNGCAPLQRPIDQYIRWATVLKWTVKTG